MQFRTFLVDAFVTSRAFSGNPAAVVLLEDLTDWPEVAWMQGIGAEFNQAETAFVLGHGEGGRFGLRWFTPKAEVDLCGHATMGATRALTEAGLLLDGVDAVFETKSGELRCRAAGDSVTMDFPVKSFEARSAPGVLYPGAVFWGNNGMDWLAELPTEEEVWDTVPDLMMIRSLGMRGLIITARSERDDYDYVCRFFAPEVGVDEDSVTGSAHCCLGPYWSLKLGRNDLVGYQASLRGGLVTVVSQGRRVEMTGRCRLFLRGELVGQSG